MEIKVLFLNCLKYQDKDTKEYKCRIAYILNDNNSKQETSNLKGLSEYAYYCDNTEVFDFFTKEDSLKPMTFVVEQRPSVKNPIKTVSILKEVKTDHGNFKLL